MLRGIMLIIKQTIFGQLAKNIQNMFIQYFSLGEVSRSNPICGLISEQILEELYVNHL